jgi:hypothetical protein
LISTLLTFEVSGDSHQELLDRANAHIADYLGLSSPEELEEFTISYDLVVGQNVDMTDESDYFAQVSARIKNARF